MPNTIRVAKNKRKRTKIKTQRKKKANVQEKWMPNKRIVMKVKIEEKGKYFENK